MTRFRFGFSVFLFIASLALPFALAAPPVTADCRIDGPGRVRAGQEFELCARGKNGHGWQLTWSGPNLSWKRGRCVEVRGLAPGSYEFRLEFKKSNKWGKPHTQVCTHRVVVGADDGGGGDLRCEIKGPSTVVEGRSFELCAKGDDDDDDDRGRDDHGGSGWSWSGPGVPGGATSRCVTVAGLPEGTYTYTLRRTRGSEEVRCTHVVTVIGGGNGGGPIACTIEAPAVVLAGQSFQLCGPSSAGTWSWSGPGVPAGSTSRCVTIAGRAAGTYTYVLRRTLNGREVTCTRAVTVLPEGGGDPDGVCPGPIRFWLEQCRTNGSGPIGIGAQTLARVAACVDERTTAWRWSDDRNSFCGLIESASIRPRDLLRQQLAVLLANRCARDFDVRLPNGSALVIDSTAGFQCGPADSGRVDSLITRAESLLVRCGDPRTSPSTCATELGALTLCLGVLNRGPDTCGLSPLPGASPALAAPLSQRGRLQPRPNPFTTSTSMSYALSAASPVEIGVYDLTGRRVRVLETGTRSPGVHEIRWDGADAGGTRVRPGVYFIRGRIGEKALEVRVVYMK